MSVRLDWKKIALEYKAELVAIRGDNVSAPSQQAPTNVLPSVTARLPAQKGIPPGPPPKKAKDGGPRPPATVNESVETSSSIVKSPINLIAALKGSFNRKKAPQKPAALPASNGITLQLHWNVPDLPISERKASIAKLKIVVDTRHVLERYLVEDLENPFKAKLHKEGPLAMFEPTPQKDTKDTTSPSTVAPVSLLNALDEAFNKKNAQKNSKTLGKINKSEKRISCLGTQMCQKWTIIFQALRKNHRHFDAIKRAILNCSLRREEIALLMEVVPDESDVKRMEEWKEAKTMLEGLLSVQPDVLLYPDEQFMKLLLSVPNLRFRVEAMAAQANFRPLLVTIEEELSILKQAMLLIIQNDDIKKLLLIILEAGNRLNRGTRWGGRTWLKVTNLQKIDELRCNHPELGKRGDAKRSLLSFVAAYVGSVICSADLLTIRKAIEISIAQPYREAIALLDVFELMSSLDSEHEQDGERENILTRKRRLSIPPESKDNNNTVEIVEFSGNESVEDPDDTFVAVCLSFVKSNRSALDEMLHEMAKVVNDYKELVIYLGCPEDVLPVDKRDNDASGEAAYIKDIFFYLGRFLVVYEREVEFELKFKKKEIENKRLKKLRDMRSAMLKPKAVIKDSTSKESLNDEENDEENQLTVASISNEDSKHNDLMKKLADEDDSHVDMALTTSRLLKSNPPGGRHPKLAGAHLAMGVELASEVNKRRELSDGGSASARKSPLQPLTADLSLKPLTSDLSLMIAEERNGGDDAAFVEDDAAMMTPFVPDDTVPPITPILSPSEGDGEVVSKALKREREVADLNDLDKLAKRRRRLSVSYVPDGEGLDVQEIYSDALSQFQSRGDESQGTIRLDHNQQEDICQPSRRRRLSISYVDQECEEVEEAVIAGTVVLEGGAFEAHLSDGPQKGSTLSNTTTTHTRGSTEVHRSLPPQPPSPQSDFLNAIIEGRHQPESTGQLPRMVEVHQAIQDPHNPRKEMEENRLYETECCFTQGGNSEESSRLVEELQSSILQSKEMMDCDHIPSPHRSHGNSNNNRPRPFDLDRYQPRGLPSVLLNVKPLRIDSPPPPASLSPPPLPPTQRLSIEGRQLVATGLRGASRAPLIGAETGDESSSDSLSEFPGLDDLISSLSYGSHIESDILAPQFTASSTAKHRKSSEFIELEEREEKRRKSLSSPVTNTRDLLTDLSSSRSRTSLKYVSSPNRRIEATLGNRYQTNSRDVSESPSDPELAGLCSETRKLLKMLKQQQAAAQSDG
eukprot:GHVH01017146.1.p1 GENE.GHVH01017146.1~~GHVH01017146.1.p1  ORF type:complete len:1257 (-),score=251.97 GHVH01017146.1:87-3857(-)